ncbi:MAG: hypothetical protein HRT44_12345, partial [Bdellovibrionales bacterium]|nr:hypothetical protein [Bdellovibrionales bacterium]NQZ20028.1 hypothetical protein [Bdellovibrionales bacterium]
RNDDRGQYVRNRDGKIEKSPVEVYGGLGLSYFNTGVNTPVASVDINEGSLILPTWRLGAAWDYSNDFRFLMALRSSSGSIDTPGNVGAVTGTDFNWLEFQIGGQYFMSKMKNARLGFDFGFGLQGLPLFRENSLSDATKTFFNNDVYALHIGVQYETLRDNMEWPYEFYARYLYPISSGDAFNIESSFPLMFEFGGGVRRQVTPGLAMGIYSQLEYFSMDVSYLDTRTTELSLMLFTVDVRLIANF